MNKFKISFFLIIILFFALSQSEPLYFCTGASSNYFKSLLNLIGSIHRLNFNELGEIAVYDLGLTAQERDQLKRIEKVTVHSLQLTHPDLLRFFTLPNGYRVLGWYAWKPVAIKQALDRFPYVLWLDAGTTVLKPLNNLLKYVQKNGYFVCTIGNEFENGKWRHPVGWGTTRFVREQFSLNKPENEWILSQEFVMGGVIGVARNGKEQFLTSLYEMTKDLRFYADDGTTPNGFGTGRHDQVLLSVLGYSRGLKIFKQDYTQQTPMMLLVDNQEVPLHITWHPAYVCGKTSIYSSRGDLTYNYTNFIKYKKN